MKSHFKKILLATLLISSVAFSESGQITGPLVVNPVSGPGAGGSTDEAVARFDGVNGAIQDSSVILSDLGSLTGILDLSAVGTLGSKIIEARSVATEDPIFRIRDADVAHGMTGFLPTDVTFQIEPFSSATGPVNIKGASSGDNPGMVFSAAIGTPIPSVSTPVVRFDLKKSDGGTGVAELGDQEMALDVYSNANALLALRGGALLGIGTNSPSASLTVEQKQTFFSVPSVFRLIGAGNSSITASNESIDVDFNLSRTISYLAGNLPFHRTVVISPPRVGFAAASTVSDGAGLFISGPPTPGSNATFTNNSSIYVAAGLASGSTNGYGLTINAPSGATSSYAARFLGGNVGVLTSTPLDPLHVAGNARVTGRLLNAKGANIASANQLTLGSDGNMFGITGTTQINLVSSTGWTAGSQAVLKFVSAGCTIKHNQVGAGAFATIMVNGSVDYVSSAGSEVLLRYDGSRWYLTPQYTP